MMTKIAAALALTLALARTGSALVCDATNSCAGQTLTFQGGAAAASPAVFQSTSAGAAAGATVSLLPKAGGTPTGVASIECTADNACAGLSLTTGTVGPSTVELACTKPHSCGGLTATFPSAQEVYAFCTDAHSCNGMDYSHSADRPGQVTELSCEGHEACSSATWRVGGSVANPMDTALLSCVQDTSCDFLTIDCLGPVNDMSIQCTPLGCKSLNFLPSCYNQPWSGNIEVCAARPCRDLSGFTTQAPVATTASAVPATTSDAAVCDQLASDWLTTQFMPTLDVVASGFQGRDSFRVSFDHHRKYFDVVPTLSAADEVLTIAEHVSTTGQSPSQCWDHYCLTATWGSVVANDNCHRENSASASGFITYTCKLVVDSKETLDPIRSTSLSREVHNEIPYQVLFPKQTSASLGGLSAFLPPNVLAAIVRQEVDVQIGNNLDLDVTVDLFTSAQWPFLLSAPTVVSTPAAIPAGSFAIETPCVDANAGDIAGAGDNANACNQVWQLKLNPDNGARSAPCELDGNYRVKFTAVCQPSFPSDCPLVKDDLGETNDVFEVAFVLDSEYFCPVVVETVDLSADLLVYKDHDHTVAATNFILGQRSYFRFVADSSEVTIASVVLDDIEVTGCSAVAGSVITDKLFPAGALFDAAAVHIENSGATPVGTIPVPAYEAWFDFPITNPPFDAPADGSCDFAVTATADVVFKDAALAALLGDAAPSRRARYSMQLMQSDGRQQVATSTFTASSDVATSAAPAAGALAGVAAIVGVAIVA